jgi:hypothetical protein
MFFLKPTFSLNLFLKLNLLPHSTEVEGAVIEIITLDYILLEEKRVSQSYAILQTEIE